MGDVVALEAAQELDHTGEYVDPLFRWWAAKVTEEAKKYSGRPYTSEYGVRFKPGRWYFKIQYFHRAPRTSQTLFELDEQSLEIDCEAVVYHGPDLQIRPLPRGKTRAAKQARTSRVYSLDRAPTAYATIKKALAELWIPPPQRKLV